MIKEYRKENVYEATEKRLSILFSEFENVLVAFSGGKDSGILLNLCYKYAKKTGQLSKLAMYHLDYEAQYTETTNYVERTFSSFDGIRKFWLCLPISAQCAVSMTQDSWIPWDEEKKEIWARPMPKSPYVLNSVECKFEKGMWDYDLQKNFCRWFSEVYGKTAVAVGIRTDESLHRMSAISSLKKVRQYKGFHWITKDEKNEDLANAYPIYDWAVDDIWIANGRNNFDYNRLYDTFWRAGLTLDDMRVASPFNDCAVNSLKVYKIVEPNMWAKLIGRVNGVNFSGIYGGTTAMGWKSIKLPPGHTWKSYMEFLLSTLPESTRNNYLDKLEASKKSWVVGGAIDDETIKELEKEGAPLIRTGKTNNRGNKDKEVIQFNDYLDDTEVTDFKRIPTYKRMCICIMKNDHTCKYMGFAQTKKELQKRKQAITKYQSIIYGKEPCHDTAN